MKYIETDDDIEQYSYRGYTVTRTKGFEPAHIWHGDEYIETTPSLEAAEKTIDEWMDAK